MSSTPTGITRVIISGAAGRMGSGLCRVAHEDTRFALIGAVEKRGSSHLGRAACERADDRNPPKITDSTGVFADRSADAVIDFSSDDGAIVARDLALRIHAALLVGTTGLRDQTRDALREAAKKIPVLLAPNTSLGVAALWDLVRRAAATLGAGYHCSIVEAHHAAKKDAPSGTALRLADAARQGGATLPDQQVLSIRGGDVVGEHTVRFAGPGEYIELTHRATSRDLFVRGALVAAAWLKGQSAGWWTMEDVLRLKP